MLNDGKVSFSKRNEMPSEAPNGNTWGGTLQTNRGARGHTDFGSYSRYFDLDSWARNCLPEQQAKVFPFALIPKASKSEKNKGLEHCEDKLTAGLPMRSRNGERGSIGGDGTSTDRRVSMKNHHPTVKPIKLMSYLIILFSRVGDTVLDPFVGSGTTCLAVEMLRRRGIGIEQDAEYIEIAQARIAAHTCQETLF